jgi:hypothetical protein
MKDIFFDIVWIAEGHWIKNALLISPFSCGSIEVIGTIQDTTNLFYAYFTKYHLENSKGRNRVLFFCC